MPHRARRCAACGQLYHGAPWSRLCPGCRAERRNMGDFNLPDNCTGEMVDAAHGEPDRDRVCMWCRHCIEECCDMGVCELRASPEDPPDFETWRELVGFLDRARVDMQIDTCTRWERL